jgi:diguanylate cyclase (GGDEF)-like protein
LFIKFDELKASKAQLKCSVSVLDIDFFKKFNDTYGHEFGDYVLEVFCSHIKKMITPLSFFARIGGEEFCLIQDKSDKAEGTIKVQEILESIKDMQLATPAEKKVNISFSAGVSEYGKDGMTLDVLLNNADKALYFAKQNGRSCVIPFSTELFEKRDDVLYTRDVARKNR